MIIEDRQVMQFGARIQDVIEGFRGRPPTEDTINKLRQAVTDALKQLAEEEGDPGLLDSVDIRVAYHRYALHPFVVTVYPADEELAEDFDIRSEKTKEGRFYKAWRKSDPRQFGWGVTPIHALSELSGAASYNQTTPRLGVSA